MLVLPTTVLSPRVSNLCSAPVEEEELATPFRALVHAAEGVDVRRPEGVREQQRHLVQPSKPQRVDGLLLALRQGRVEFDRAFLQ